MDKFNQKWVLQFAQDGKYSWAITLGQRTYYSESEQYVALCPAWQRHENCHKMQWKRDGLLKFAAKYLWYQIRYGYGKNPYEIEARNT